MNKLFNSNPKNKAPFIAIAATIFLFIVVAVVLAINIAQTEDVEELVDEQTKELKSLEENRKN